MFLLVSLFSATPCADVDECRDGSDNCGLVRECVNTPGSFDCVVKTCPVGYRLDYDTGTCQPFHCRRGHRPSTNGRCVGTTHSRCCYTVSISIHSGWSGSERGRTEFQA